MLKKFSGKILVLKSYSRNFIGCVIRRMKFFAKKYFLLKFSKKWKFIRNKICLSNVSTKFGKIDKHSVKYSSAKIYMTYTEFDTSVYRNRCGSHFLEILEHFWTFQISTIWTIFPRFRISDFFFFKIFFRWFRNFSKSWCNEAWEFFEIFCNFVLENFFRKRYKNLNVLGKIGMS